MSYPNYPGYPSNNQENQNAYPMGQTPTYPQYPSAQASYPNYPSYPDIASNQYSAGAPSYPAQTPQPYYAAPNPSYPQYNYNPSGPQQVGYPSAAVPPSGPQFSATGGNFPSTTPAAYNQVVMEQNIPTVHPVSPFDARADADALHKAMKGLGTNEKVLIQILCHRTSAQRTAINQAFKSGYGKDLESKIKGEVSGSFEKLLVALCLPMAEFMAREMNEAVRGLGTNEGTLVEILCSGTNQEIREINAAYQRLYGHSMEQDVKGDTSGELKHLLVSLAQGQRDENQVVNIEKAKADAQLLFQAGAAKTGTDESAFNSILATRSWAHLRQVMAEYQAMHGHSLEKAVMSEFSANAEKGLLGILQCAQSRPGYFAQRLNTAMKGLGTKDGNLIRIIVTRCDIDLGNIKREYEKKFNKGLQTDIAGDTSGDYKKALLALLA